MKWVLQFKFKILFLSAHVGCQIEGMQEECAQLTMAGKKPFTQ